MTQPKRPRFRTGRLVIHAGQPISLEPEKGTVVALTAPQKKALRQIAGTIGAYLKSGHDLLAGTYAGVKDIAPPHLAVPSRAFIILASDCVFVRYERSQDEEAHFVVGTGPHTIEDLAPGFSEGVLYCGINGADPSNITPESGARIITSLFTQATGEQTTVSETRILYVCRVPPAGEVPPVQVGKPFRLLGVESQFEIQMHAEAFDEGHPERPGQPFITRGKLQLPVGWRYIELYPNVDLKYWNKDVAASWAENDILGAVTRHTLQEERFRALDPNVDARRVWAQLLDEYRALLDSSPLEEALQQFLNANPALLAPIHKSVWPKVKFGKKISDFVFREADGDYLLVELELSTAKLFLKSGDTSASLGHAQNQIIDWKQIIAEHPAFVRDVLGLEGISPNPKSLIVMGRSKDLSAENRQKLTTLQSENPRQKIMTYDDVLENAKAAIENILGPLWASTGTAQVYFLGPNTTLPTGPIP